MSDGGDPKSDIVMLRPTQRISHDAESAGDHDDTADLGRMLRSIWRRKWFVLAFAFVAAVLCYVVAAAQPFKYTARATVMLDAREQRVISAQDQVVADLKLNSPILESEVAVLRSRSLAETVVTDIGIDRFDSIDPANVAPGPVRRAVNSVRSLFGAEPGQAGQPATAVNTPLVTPEERRLNRIVTELREGIRISRIGSSYVIEVTATTIDPELSALVANGLVDTYVAAQLQDRRRVAVEATRWLADQVERRREELSEVEARVEDYKQDQLNATGSSTEMVEQQLAELNRQLVLARSDRASEEARLGQVETLLADRGAAAVADTYSSAFLDSLKEERKGIIREDARLAATLGVRHPDRLDLASELTRIDALIADEVSNIIQTHRNEIEVFGSRETSLQNDLDALEQQLAEISSSSLILRQLEREADVAKDSYESMLARLGEIRAQAELQRAEAKLINAAQIPLGPSAPRRNLIAAFGGTVGLTIGLIAALVMEVAGAGFQRSVELEKATGMRVLAVLPRVRVDQPASVLRLLKKEAYSLLAERYRQLRTVLTMSVPGRSQTILVMSSVAREGKTTTALSLAYFFSKSGASTILVDLDTRRASLQKELMSRPASDLSDYLQGQATLDEAIARPGWLEFDITGTERHKALFADGASNAWIKDLFDQLKERYDVIVVDAPPVLAVSEGLAIASAVDNILYLVRWRHTSRKSVDYGLAALKDVGVRPTGLVMSIADIDADPDVHAQNYNYS